MSLAIWLPLVIVASTLHPSDDVVAPGLRLEHFALVRCATDGDWTQSIELSSAGPCFGIVEWRRRELADGVQLECESHFFDTAPNLTAAPVLPAAHVLHVERLTALGPRLVWRELSAGSGRCLRAEWSRDGAGLVTRDWGERDSTAEVLSTARGAVMPLFLLELARTGCVTAGTFTRFDPLVAALEPIEMCTRYDKGPGAESLRIVEEWHTDGTLAGRFVFRGTALAAFQWQDGDVWARPISAAEYESRAGPDASVDSER